MRRLGDPTGLAAGLFIAAAVAATRGDAHRAGVLLGVVEQRRYRRSHAWATRLQEAASIVEGELGEHFCSGCGVGSLDAL